MKQVEQWWSDGKENFSLVFEVGGGLENRMIFEVFLMITSWQEKSKVILGPSIFFDGLDNETKCRWLEPVLKSVQDLVGGLSADGMSSLRSLANLEEEWWDEWLIFF